jgi:hypothetical protein
MGCLWNNFCKLIMEFYGLIGLVLWAGGCCFGGRLAV